MAADISATTNETFYSGTWQDVQDIIRVLNIGEGKMAQVTQPMVNRYQEMVDRDIDAILNDTYQTPIRAFNLVGLTGAQGLGTQGRVFPGDVRRAARYWVAGQLLVSEFQQLEANITEQATQMVSDARMQVFAMGRPTHRIPGQRRKSNISRTMPPNLQPSAFPERPV
jgi:hypothetical protein